MYLSLKEDVMKSILLLPVVFLNVASLFAQPSNIHKMSPANDILMPLPNGKYEYDAYLILLRKFENRKQLQGENYDSLTYFTHAYAVFYEDNWWRTDVSTVSVNGYTLLKPTGKDYYEALIPEFEMSMLRPRIKWKITDSTGYFSNTSTNEDSLFQFPELFYISDIPDHFPMVFGENTEWSFTASKWNENQSFSLTKPDLVNLWVVSQTNNSASLSNFQPQRFRDGERPDFRFATYGRWMSPLSQFNVISGRGSAVVRSYKFYPYKAEASSPGSKINWLIVTIAETELPLEFR
jgi:hypothetical protein